AGVPVAGTEDGELVAGAPGHVDDVLELAGQGGEPPDGHLVPVGDHTSHHQGPFAVDLGDHSGTGAVSGDLEVDQRAVPEFGKSDPYDLVAPAQQPQGGVPRLGRLCLAVDGGLLALGTVLVVLVVLGLFGLLHDPQVAIDVPGDLGEDPVVQDGLVLCAGTGEAGDDLVAAQGDAGDGALVHGEREGLDGHVAGAEGTGHTLDVVEVLVLPVVGRPELAVVGVVGTATRGGRARAHPRPEVVAGARTVLSLALGAGEIHLGAVDLESELLDVGDLPQGPGDLRTHLHGVKVFSPSVDLH